MDVSHSQSTSGTGSARSVTLQPSTPNHTHTHTLSSIQLRLLVGATGIEGTGVHAPASFSHPSLALCARAVPLCALPLRDRLQRAWRADERQRGREKDGGEGRGETPVPGGAVQRLLRGFGLREIRERHREHQRGERLFFFLFTSLISCDSDTATDGAQWERDSTAYPHAGVSEADCTVDTRRANRQFTVKLP